LADEDEIAKSWAAFERSSPSNIVYEKVLAEQWRIAGCSTPYILRTILFQLDRKEDNRFEEKSQEPPALASNFLDKSRCAGSDGLTDEERTTLETVRDRASPPSKH
jgi:hypothetical protein